MTTVLMGTLDDECRLRIPSSLCDQLGFVPSGSVLLTIENHRLTVEPGDEAFTLRERMKRWNKNRYTTVEYDWGKPCGEEL